MSERGGDKERGRQGEGEIRRRGDEEIFLSLSPPLLVSPSVLHCLTLSRFLFINDLPGLLLSVSFFGSLLID
jgi:hypothetical protein